MLNVKRVVWFLRLVVTLASSVLFTGLTGFTQLEFMCNIVWFFYVNKICMLCISQGGWYDNNIDAETTVMIHIVIFPGYNVSFYMLLCIMY